jgi:hypothetical protein
MSRPAVGVGLAILAAAAVQILLVVEARLAAGGERKLAAAASALSVAAAIACLLVLTLLAGQLVRWVRETRPWLRRRAAAPPSPGPSSAGDRTPRP